MLCIISLECDSRLTWNGFHVRRSHSGARLPQVCRGRLARDFTDSRAATLAINPPSDIILGVARAADPSKYQAAADRLARISGTAAGVDAAQPPRTVPGEPESAAAPRALRPVSALPADRRPSQLRGTSDPLSQFEAFVLQSFVQSMLPKHADRVFGRGTAGEVWKSMLAEMLGNELAQGGRVGIARQMAESASARAGGVPPAELARPAASLQSTLPYLRIPSVGAADVAGAGSSGTDRS